jgi:DNA-binding XRE family transcriptional regulator
VPPAHVTLPTLLLLEPPLPATAPERDDPPALYDPAKLRAWRADSGLTREQVCSMTGVSYPWLRKLERGEADPSLKLLVTLARFYGHEPGELVGGPQ